MNILVPPVGISPRICDECPEDCLGFVCPYTPSCDCFGCYAHVELCDPLDCVVHK